MGGWDEYHRRIRVIWGLYCTMYYDLGRLVRSDIAVPPNAIARSDFIPIFMDLPPCLSRSSSGDDDLPVITIQHPACPRSVLAVCESQEAAGNTAGLPQSH